MCWLERTNRATQQDNLLLRKGVFGLAKSEKSDKTLVARLIRPLTECSFVATNRITSWFVLSRNQRFLDFAISRFSSRKPQFRRMLISFAFGLSRISFWNPQPSLTLCVSRVHTSLWLHRAFITRLVRLQTESFGFVLSWISFRNPRSCLTLTLFATYECRSSVIRSISELLCNSST